MAGKFLKTTLFLLVLLSLLLIVISGGFISAIVPFLALQLLLIGSLIIISSSLLTLSLGLYSLEEKDIINPSKVKPLTPPSPEITRPKPILPALFVPSPSPRWKKYVNEEGLFRSPPSHSPKTKSSSP